MKRLAPKLGTPAQSSSVSSPVIVCPGEIGIANGGHAAALVAAVKSSSAMSGKSRDAGVKVSGPRLGVTRYVVPVSKPLWVLKPDASV